MHAERDRLFERMFEESSDSAYLMDPIAGRILDANSAGCKMLEYTREELLATPVSEIHPSEHAQMSEFVDRVLRERRGSTIKLTCRTKTGVYLPTEMTFHAFESRGHLYVLGLVQDRSEHRMRPSED
jgi:two-component system, chemotaxis family, sensor kinase Cph1